RRLPRARELHSRDQRRWHARAVVGCDICAGGRGDPVGGRPGLAFRRSSGRCAEQLVALVCLRVASAVLLLRDRDHPVFRDGHSSLCRTDPRRRARRRPTKDRRIGLRGFCLSGGFEFFLYLSDSYRRAFALSAVAVAYVVQKLDLIYLSSPRDRRTSGGEESVPLKC